MAYQPTTNYGWAMPRGGDQAQISVINEQFTAKADEIVYQTRRMIAPGYIDDGTKTYHEGDIVEYENVDYVCTGTTSGAWDSSKWVSTDMATQIQEAKESGGGASALADLDDVEITSPTEGQILTYDDANDEWVNTDMPDTFSGDYDDLTNKPTLGTASSKDVAASGNASSTQVVMGNDTRLTDRRGSTWGQINGTLANQTDLKNSIDSLQGQIDTFTALTPGSTTGDAELTNIRVDSTGHTYPTAGDAVRAIDSQVNAMKTGFDGVTYPSPVQMVNSCDQKLQDQEDITTDRINVTKAEYDNYITQLNNGATFNSSTGVLTIPSGSSGNNSYAGYRINNAAKIAALKGSTVYIKLKFTIASEIVSYCSFRALFSGSGVTIQRVAGSINDGYAIFKTVFSNDITTTYFGIAVNITNAYTFDHDVQVSLNSCEIDYYYVEDVVNSAIADVKAYETKGIPAVIQLDDVDSMSGGATYSNSTITIPSGSTGLNSYAGKRIMRQIGTILGRKMKCTIKFTCSNTSLTGLVPSVNNNGTGVSLTKASTIDLVNGICEIFVNVRGDATATYLIFALKLTGIYTYSEDITIQITDYDIEFMYEDVEDARLFENVYHGLKMSCMGHSMVQQDRWQQTTQNDIRLESYENTAIYGGTLIEHYQDVSNISTDSDIIVVWYDTNDWANNKTLGTIADALPDTLSFYSALKYVCDWIGTNIPKAKVILVSSPKRFDNVFQTTDSKGYQINNNGDTLEDFANAIKDVADLYSYRYCDLFHRSGINAQNCLSYLDSDKLHPSNYGAGKIGHMIASTILQ